MAYIIDPEKCSGCGTCADQCPMEAITADGQGQYRIDPEHCTDCGTCADVCPEEAIRGAAI